MGEKPWAAANTSSGTTMSRVKAAALQCFACLLALMLLVGLAGCEDYIAFRCADPNATPMVGRDDAGQLVYDGCVLEDGDSDGAADEAGQ